ncbi:MAG: histidine kinase [bacterium]|nr:histidine kinase [bacterium]
MLKMSIRRKLFLAFALVAAISSAALLLLAGSYIQNVRAQLDRHFVEDARAALHRQDERAAFIQDQVFDALNEVAAEPDLLKKYANPSQLGGIFDRVPALVQIALWDSSKHELVGTMVRPGAHAALLQNIDQLDLAAELQTPRAHIGKSAVIYLSQNGPLFHVATIGSKEAPRGYAIGEVDLEQLGVATTFGHEGQALVFDLASGKPWMAADSAARARESLPGMERLLTQRPSNGETADVDDGRGRRYRVYAAVSGETPLRLFNDRLEALVVMPTDELYAPLAQIRVRVLASVIATVVLAFLAAFLLSGRFVADIARIREAVAAFAQGDWRRLEKSSRDELGGSLVDSINDMTIAVAERMRRDEAESWRSLVRVVSHEINNTLAPIRSVATSLRSGLDKRLRDDDAGADVDMALKLIVERVDALATFIDGYAEVAKLPQPDRRLADVERLVGGATTLFAEDAERRGVALDVRAAGVGAVELDAQQMERVLVNLVKNALEASPRGSAVDVIAGRVAGGLEILVADAGPGISPEARRNLFVPYFTTKPGGSGIGLALARQIVVAHGGTITAERSPSGGTLMRVLLPEVARSHPYREVG